MDKKFEFIAVADLVQEKNFKNEMQTFIRSKLGSLRKDALKCS